MLALLAVFALQDAAPAAAAKPPAPEPAHVEPPKNLDEAVSMLTRLADHARDWLITKGPMVLLAVILFLFAWFIAGWVRRAIVRICTRAKVDLTLAKFLGNMAKWAIIVFALITVAGTLGLSTTGFAAAIAGAGLAVGLALQGNLGNLASGVLLLIFRPFKIGDAVIVAGQSGVVDGIDLFTTNLDTADNRRIIVPNGAIFSGVIENQTHHPRRCVTVSVPVAGSASLDDVPRLLAAAVDKVVAANIGALTDPAPGVVLADLAPTVTYAVTVWAITPQFPIVRQRLLRELKLAVDAAQIAPGPPVQVIQVASLPEPRH
jgi:small conductance mechanosensitive channel